MNPIDIAGKAEEEEETVGTFAFPDCHQHRSVGSSLCWGLNFRVLLCGIFGGGGGGGGEGLGGVSGYSCFLPSFID